MWAFCCGVQATLVAACRLQSVCRLSSCRTWAEMPHGMWDISSPTRDQTHVPCIGRWMLNYWTTREVPDCLYDKFADVTKLRILKWEDYSGLSG